MSKAAFIRRGKGMFPLDKEGETMILALPECKPVMGTFKGARNVRHHRMFFALMKVLAENTDLFGGDVELARKTILTDCRECDLWVHPLTGEVRVEVRSMSFEKMDQAHFSRLFDRALYVICNNYLAGADAEEVRAQVYEIVDGPAAIGRRVA